MPVVSKAQRKAQEKHDRERVDKITVRLPKGTKDAIRSAGYTVNWYVIQAVSEKMIREGIGK